ncbi:MAG: ABC transporter permease subunit [Alphaproteobacteria bacterium]|nr:ABC transporter permease subunit [Alphaproteobacteria bacterium]
MAEVALSPHSGSRTSRLFELRTILFTIVLLVTLFLVLYPVLLIVLYSFNAGEARATFEFGLEPWRYALSDPSMFGTILNSLKLLVAIHGIALPIAVAISWVLARTDIPWRHGLEFMFWISFFLPSLSVTLGWIMCLDPQYGLFNKLATLLPFVEEGPFNIYSFWGIVWAHLGANSIALKVMLLTPTFRNMDSSLEEASRVAGAGRMTTVARIVVPAMMPALIAIVLMAMIRAMQSFEIELVLGPPFEFFIYSTKVYSLIAQEPPQFGAASALATLGLAVILPLIFAQRHLTLRRQYTTLTGKLQTQPVRLGPWRLPVFFAVLTVVLLLTVVPLVFVALASFMKLFGFFNLPDPYTLNHWIIVLRDAVFVKGLWNTLVMAVGAGFFSVILFSLIAYFTVRTTFRARALLDFISWLPFAVPGLLFGVGLLYVFLESPLFRPLYGSMFLLVLATVISSMTLGTQIIKSNMMQLGHELEEASRVTGATWWYTFTRVVLPIMMPVLLLVGVMNFISAARDVASVALIATAETKTLALLQLDFMVEGRTEPAAVVSLVVVAMSTGVALLARALGLRIGIRN